MKQTTFAERIAYFACVAALAGCATADQAPTTGEEALFLRVDKPEGLKLDTMEKLDSMAVKADRAESDKDFYIAVHKDVLGSGRKFFMSAYMKTLNTDLSGTSGAYSMGTRVVSLEAQNGSVLVFDVDDTRLETNAFDSQIVLDAFPIVSNYDAFNGGENAEDYVLIDPAAGQNEFALFGQASTVPFEGGQPGQAVDVHVAFLQDFQEVEDGIIFEKVFAGTATEGIQLENVYGTLGIGFRNYKESDGFVESIMPEVPHYFGAKPRVGKPSDLEPNPVHPVGKWHVYEGMEPIEWVISPVVAELQKEPMFKGVDLEAAFIAGIENWNSVFGFEAFRARLAGPDESFADDSVNYFVVDYPGFVGAFADWRINPNTGEIRGASVLMSADLPLYAATYLYPEEEEPLLEPNPNAQPVSHHVPAQHSRLHWGPMPGGPLCNYELDPEALQASLHNRAGNGVLVDDLTREEKIERFITGIAIHEIGHTLGLRHNFKGSLIPGSSSVMDYLDDLTDGLERHVPGTYDIAAVRWLYGLGEELPKEPFCTDDNVWGDPSRGVVADADCNRFDRGAKPLTDSYAPLYTGFVDAYLAGELPFPEFLFELYLPYDIIDIGRYAWFDHEDAALVPEILFANVGVPVDPERVAAEPEFARRADIVTKIALKELFDSIIYDLAPPGYFVEGQFTPSRNNPELTSAIMRQLSGVLVNEDEIRSFESRRLAVSLLKEHQSDEALEVLSQAKVIIDEQLAGEPSTAMQELANQVNAALNPYFE